MHVLEGEWRPAWSMPHRGWLNRVLPLVLLAASAGMAAAAVAGGFHSWPRYFAGLPVAAAAAIWSPVTTRLASSESAAARTGAFVVYMGLAAALVWVSPWYGIFAWSGFMMVSMVDRRFTLPAIVLVALVLAGSQSGGYPTSPGHAFIYVMMAAVNAGIAFALLTVAMRLAVQHDERGRMIAQLAEANQRLEATMAENAGLHSQLLTQAREAGMLDERQRLAGEIHDTLAQSFTGIVTQLEAAIQARHLPEQWSRHVGQAQNLARTGLSEARRSVRALRPEQLERAGLADALLSLGRDWSESTGIDLRSEIVGTPQELAPEIAAAVFRVAQEALTNAGKHASPTKVALTVTYLPKELLLDVRDNGVGYDPDAPSSGYGLRTMRDRLIRIGGTLTIESAPGSGTAVNASVPLAGDVG
jgi:signal transduction histidine kinase